MNYGQTLTIFDKLGGTFYEERRKYDDLAEGSVNYVAFSVDVDPTETFSSRERLPAAPVPQTTFTGGFRVPKVHEGLLKSM